MSDAAAPATPVAVKVTGVIPAAVAVTVFVPAVVPSVQLPALATPSAPVTALVTGSVLVSALVSMNFHKSLVEIFTFMILLSTTATLVAYLSCSLALLVLLRRGRVASRHAAWLATAGAFGAFYSLWAIAGAGRSATLWGAVLILAGLPVHALMRAGRKAPRDGVDSPVRSDS